MTIVEITNGRKGAWYENKVGKQFEVYDEQEYITNEYNVIDYDIISYTKLINESDCKVVEYIPDEEYYNDNNDYDYLNIIED